MDAVHTIDRMTPLDPTLLDNVDGTDMLQPKEKNVRGQEFKEPFTDIGRDQATPAFEGTKADRRANFDLEDDLVLRGYVSEIGDIILEASPIIGQLRRMCDVLPPPL